MVYKHYIIMLFNHLLSLRIITKVFWKGVRIRIEYLKGEMFLILTLARSFFFIVKKYLSNFKAKAVKSRVQIAKTILLSSNLQVSLLQIVLDKISSLPIPLPRILYCFLQNFGPEQKYIQADVCAIREREQYSPANDFGFQKQKAIKMYSKLH